MKINGISKSILENLIKLKEVKKKEKEL